MPYGDRNREREIHPVTPFLFLQCRDTEQKWAANTFIVWNIESVNTKDFKYTKDTSKIFVLTSGYYEIGYNLSLYIDKDALTHTDMRILRNGVIMPGSMSSSSFPDQYPVTISAFYYAYLDRGDYLQLESVVGGGGGTISTLLGTVRFIIKFMPQQGWNNSRGGAENYRGGVSR